MQNFSGLPLTENRQGRKCGRENGLFLSFCPPVFAFVFWSAERQFRTPRWKVALARANSKIRRPFRCPSNFASSGPCAFAFLQNLPAFRVPIKPSQPKPITPDQSEKGGHWPLTTKFSLIALNCA
jgi:hypothetical protein